MKLLDGLRLAGKCARTRKCRGARGGALHAGSSGRRSAAGKCPHARDRKRRPPAACRISAAAAGRSGCAHHGAAPSLFEILEEVERRIIVDMLERTNWNQTEAAERFQIPLSTLNQKIKRLGIETRRRANPPSWVRLRRRPCRFFSGQIDAKIRMGARFESGPPFVHLANNRPSTSVIEQVCQVQQHLCLERQQCSASRGNLLAVEFGVLQ